VLHSVRPRYDHVLIDTGAGISDVVLHAVSLADDVLIVATPEPTSLADAYATIKVLATQQGRRSMLITVNQVSRNGEGRGVAQQLQTVVDRFVKLPDSQAVKLRFVGEIPTDKTVREAVQRRQLLMQTFPGCSAAQAITQVATKVEEAIRA